MSEEVASELLWSDVHENVLSDLKLPWPATLIVFPSTLFQHVKSHALVARIREHYVMDASDLDESLGDITHTFRSPGEFLAASLDDCDDPRMLNEYVLFCRLVANVLVAATDPGNSGPGPLLDLQKPSRRTNSGKRRLRHYSCKETPSKYVLRNPITIQRGASDQAEILEAARNLIRTGQAKVGVRTWVRGHWRNQVCGPMVRDENGKRRWQHRRREFIASHMRGPKGAPLSIGPHILGSTIGAAAAMPLVELSQTARPPRSCALDRTNSPPAHGLASEVTQLVKYRSSG